MNGNGNGSGNGSNGNGNGNGNGYISMNSQMPQMPQSWNELVVMQPMDPRSIIAVLSFEDSGGTLRTATFVRSTTFIPTAATWGTSPLTPSAGGGPTTPNIIVPNAYDYASNQIASVWNATRQMTPLVPTILAPAVQTTAFLKAGPAFVNNLYFDWKVGVTTSSIQVSMRDNATTSGMFQNGALGTVPVFALPSTATYGGLGRNFQVTMLRTGRFNVGMLVVDSTGTTSMLEMDWIVM